MAALPRMPDVSEDDANWTKRKAALAAGFKTVGLNEFQEQMAVLNAAREHRGDHWKRAIRWLEQYEKTGDEMWTWPKMKRNPSYDRDSATWPSGTPKFQHFICPLCGHASVLKARRGSLIVPPHTEPKTGYLCPASYKPPSSVGILTNPVTPGMNDRERQLWVDNDKSLYRWQQSSRLGMRRFIQTYRDQIDQYIQSQLSQKPRANPPLLIAMNPAFQPGDLVTYHDGSRGRVLSVRGRGVKRTYEVRFDDERVPRQFGESTMRGLFRLLERQDFLANPALETADLGLFRSKPKPKGRTRRTRKNPWQCPACGKARLAEHLAGMVGGRQRYQVACSNCGWSGSTNKPLSYLSPTYRASPPLRRPRIVSMRRRGGTTFNPLGAAAVLSATVPVTTPELLRAGALGIGGAFAADAYRGGKALAGRVTGRLFGKKNPLSPDAASTLKEFMVAANEMSARYSRSTLFAALRQHPALYQYVRSVRSVASAPMPSAAVLTQARAFIANWKEAMRRARETRWNPAVNLPPAVARYAHLPGFQAALNRYVKFHGCLPTSVSRHNLPIGRARDVVVMAAMGEAPAESYRPLRSMSRSNKAGSVWVHPYESHRKPIKAVDGSGRLIVTLPGSHRVSDWLRG